MYVFMHAPHVRTCSTHHCTHTYVYTFHTFIVYRTVLCLEKIAELCVECREVCVCGLAANERSSRWMEGQVTNLPVC